VRVPSYRWSEAQDVQQSAMHPEFQQAISLRRGTVCSIGDHSELQVLARIAQESDHIGRVVVAAYGLADVDGEGRTPVVAPVLHIHSLHTIKKKKNIIIVKDAREAEKR
jgi:hypothetical protein